MSQPLASSSMSTPPTTAPSSNFRAIFEESLKAYKTKTNQDLAAHPLASQLQACNSTEAILTVLQDQRGQSIQSQGRGDKKLERWLSATTNVLYTFSSTLGEGVGTVFPPANVILAGVGVLLSAAKDVGGSQDIIYVFERIEYFFRRLEMYTKVPSTPAIVDMVVKIMVEVLNILGTATNEMQLSRAKKFLRKAVGKSNLEDSLKRLDNMTSRVDQMVIMELLNAHNINAVRGDAQAVINDELRRGQLREHLRRWQSPPDPSTNHNTECDIQLQGTAEWFLRGGVFKEWMVKGSLLWIHGKPGSGKSVLCSAIIQTIAPLYDAGSASLAYFYFDFRDLDKRSRHNLLPSLLIQLSARSDPFCDILSDLYQAHDHGAHQPSDRALVDCLKEMLTLRGQAPVYLILDALDECPNTSGVTSSRGQVLDLIKDLVHLGLPSLHICVTSRPEVDIKDALGSLVSYMISLHDESGQKENIAEYIRSVVYSDRRIGRWREDDKDLVIQTLSERADGMFRWVFCQLETLRVCLPQGIRRALNDFPATLDETYERILKEIRTTNGHHAYRLLQCLSVAIRLLCVEELAEILALDFDGVKADIPELKEDWRWNDPQEAVLSTCSSLIAVVDDGPRRVVKFSHFSVLEFLTSNRLATSSPDISRFYILRESAHTVIAKACLGILLQSDNGVGDAEAENNSPLAKYAAEHWVNHAQAMDVSADLRVGMRRLFDPTKTYFEAWLKLYDVDQGWIGFTDNDKQQQRGSLLYYASLCGFRDLAEDLVIQYPLHVNATLGRCLSPLAAALHMGHLDIAELLLHGGADGGIRGYKNRTLLHAASAGGFFDAARWLLDHGVGAHSRQDNRRQPPYLADADGYLGHRNSVDVADDSNQTPLHLASLGGHFNIVRLLVEHGADVTSQDRTNQTSLHLASSSGSPDTVRLLIGLRANVHTRDMNHKTPLHLASSSGSPEIVRVLLMYDADVIAKDESHNTPLHLASSSGSPDTVRLLIEHGAAVNAMGAGNKTPLDLALSSGSHETVQVLIAHGADINATARSNKMPLHPASSSGAPEPVRDSIEHVTDIDSTDGSNKMPLHPELSSGAPESVRDSIEHVTDIGATNGSNKMPLHPELSSGAPESVRDSIEHDTNVGATGGSNKVSLHPPSFSWSPETVRLWIESHLDVNVRDGNHKTPLHLASSSGSLETVRVLIERGADINSRDGLHNTPLHLASSLRSPEIVQLLLSNGAIVTSQDPCYWTPLHQASSSGTPETVLVLISNGADVNARDEKQNTPLHLASSSGSPEIVQVLLENHADVDARDGNLKTPLHLASFSWSPETVKLLIDHGAAVDAKDENQKMPLHLASSSRCPDTVRLLIDRGANVDSKDGGQNTPLHLVSSSRSPEAVRLLIELGADVDAKDGKGNTPLHLALSSWRPETVRLLLKNGANVNARDGGYKTALHLASSQDETSLKPTAIQRAKSNGKADIVRALIEYGADVTARDNTGSTPLHLASSKGSGRTVELLLAQKVNVNARDGKKSTPLHLAASSRLAFEENVVHLLLNHGADADAKDDRGQIPYQIAFSNGLTEIAGVLSAT